jgi:hypothetical protein
VSTAKAKCPAFWTTDEHCPRDDESGRHICNLADDHTKCRCRCGSTHKRPVNHVKRFEERIGRASVSIDESGRGRVVVGLTDISNQVGGGIVEFKAGHATVIKVEMPKATLAARGEIELDEETAKALEALGWSGPDTELLRRRDLQEALGGLGTVLREWDDLLAIVRQLNALLDDVPVSLGGRNEG